MTAIDKDLLFESESDRCGDTPFVCTIDDIGFAHNINSLKNVLSRQPTINECNVKYAEWIYCKDNKARCSSCDVICFIAMYPNGIANYCPNCGCKMKFCDPRNSDFS